MSEEKTEIELWMEFLKSEEEINEENTQLKLFDDAV